MNDTLLSGLIVGIIALIFWTPYLMSKGVSSLEGDVSFKEKLLCFTPVFNIIRAEKKYYGKVGLTSIAVVTSIVAIVFRIVCWYKFYSNVTLGTISLVVFYLGILFYIIANCKFVYNVINDADAVSGGKLMLYTIAFPFGQFYIGSFLANVIKHNMNKEATFKG